MSTGCDQAVAAAHVCFAPKATALLRHRERALCANRVLTRRSRQQRYSITSSPARVDLLCPALKF